MRRLDLKKELRGLYSPTAREVEVVRVPEFNYLMIDGAGDPKGSIAFERSVQALFAASYTLKFMIRKEKLVDYPVMPLEGLWWAESMDVFRSGKRCDWKWTLMILQPPVVKKALVQKALSVAIDKKGIEALREVRLESYVEGLSLQIMHLGPYAQEGPTIDKLHSFAVERGLVLLGKHHEIYLSDPRRSVAPKMKTIIRQPVKRTGR